MKLEDLQFKTPYLKLGEAFYHSEKPTPLDEPYLISFNPHAAKLINLDTTIDTKQFLAFLNGTSLPKKLTPFSMCYAGHQFGNYAPRLGDGRVIHYGSVNGWHLQTKGSGETLYSRSDDGRATLPSSIREYLMSEAMYHLGIPTTRALGIMGSKTKVVRNGIEYGSIVMRLSQSWVRFGTFEYFYYAKAYKALQALADYVIEESYPHLIHHEDKYYTFFAEVVDNTATLIAKWQGIGFCHGVVNTDNMSIAGLTLDYGPFAMLDDFDFGFVCNKSDRAGRYAYGEQPNISYWNLTKLSQALSPLIDKKQMQQKLDDYGNYIYPDAYINVMREKLGLKEKLDEDRELIENLVVTLQDSYIDYTLFFRTLSHYDRQRMPIFELAMNPIPLDRWLDAYDARLKKEAYTDKERHQVMLKTNPKYVLKNYMLDEAITLAKKGDFSMVETLLHIVTQPFEELEEFEHLAQETKEEHKNITFSCTS